MYGTLSSDVTVVDPGGGATGLCQSPHPILIDFFPVCIRMLPNKAHIIYQSPGESIYNPKDAMVEFDQIRFIFQHSLPHACDPHTSSIGFEGLGFSWYRSSHPDPRKSVNCRYMISSSVRSCSPAKCFCVCWGTE